MTTSPNLQASDARAHGQIAGETNPRPGLPWVKFLARESSNGEPDAPRDRDFRTSPFQKSRLF